MILLAVIAAWLMAEPENCLAVNGDAVTAGDLAVAIPVFGTLPSETRLIPSPRAGVRRFLTPSELIRIAKRFELKMNPPEDICVTVPLRRIDPESVKRALQESLSQGEVNLEELLTPEGPAGTLEFPRTGLTLGSGSDGRGSWRGAVVYGNGRRYPLLCRVLIHQSQIRLIAKKDIRANEPLTAEDFDQVVLPQRTSGADSIQAAEVEGWVLRTPLKQGGRLFRSALIRRPAVKAGETVRVDAWQGAAHLVLEGRAEKNGFLGDWVTVRNPGSGKRFSAQVLSDGRVGLGDLP